MLPASNLLPADGASKVPMNASVPVASSVSSGPVHSRAAIIGKPTKLQPVLCLSSYDKP